MRRRIRTLTVVVAALTSIVATPRPAAHAATCDNSWRSGVYGRWSDASKWSAGHVPTGTEHVCVTLAGTYNVTILGPAAAGSLLLGSAAPGFRELHLLVPNATLTLHQTSSVIGNGTARLANGAKVAVGSGATLNIATPFGVNVTSDWGTLTGTVAVVAGGSIVTQGVLDTRAASVSVAGTVVIAEHTYWRAGPVTVTPTGTLAFTCTQQDIGRLDADGPLVVRGLVYLTRYAACTPPAHTSIAFATTIAVASATYAGLYQTEPLALTPAFYRPRLTTTSGTAALALSEFRANVDVAASAGTGTDISYSVPTAFIPGDTISVSIRDHAGTSALLARVPADANGGVAATLSIPSGLAAGTAQISATGTKHITPLVSSIALT